MDSYNDPSGSAAYLAFLLVLIPLILIFALAFYIISAFFLMRIFEKAGVEGKWRAWVPVYNTLVSSKLGDLSPWVTLVVLVASGVLGQIPFIGWIFSLAAIAVGVMHGWRLGLKLGKDWPWLLLWLIPGVGTLIWLGILAFGSARWNPNIPPAPWANTFLGDKTVWHGIPVQPSAPAAAAPGAYPPPAGYQAPPPAGYQPPPGYAVPPAPGAATPPPAEPSLTQPPAQSPATPPPATPPATPPTAEPPASTTEPPAPPTEPGDQPRP